MRYIKRFNEELKPSTYMSASRKLSKLGHSDRAEELKSFAEEAEKREEIIKWRDRLQDYALFGTFKVNIQNPETSQKMTADFALDINFDQDCFEDSFEYERGQAEDPNNISGLGFLFFIGLIPTSEEVIRQCEEIMPSAEFDNGFFWGMTVSLNFDIVNGKVVFKSFFLDNYDDGQSGKVSFADRVSAGKFKTLLKNIFSNPDFNYPSAYTDIEYLYQKLEQVICISQGFSSDYGFDLQHAADFISQQSPNTMYKTL